MTTILCRLCYKSKQESTRITPFWCHTCTLTYYSHLAGIGLSDGHIFDPSSWTHIKCRVHSPRDADGIGTFIESASTPCPESCLFRKENYKKAFRFHDGCEAARRYAQSW